MGFKKGDERLDNQEFQVGDRVSFQPPTDKPDFCKYQGEKGTIQRVGGNLVDIEWDNSFSLGDGESKPIGLVFGFMVKKYLTKVQEA